MSALAKPTIRVLGTASIPKFVAILALLVATLCGACTQQVGLAYIATGAPTAAQGSATIGQVTVIDQRGEADPTWIGAIRGGYGNPLKVLHLSQPLKDVVAEAFRDALKVRGMLSAGGLAPFDIHVTVVKFESTQMARREAEATIAMEVLKHTMSKQAYRDTASVDLVSGSILALDTGILASTVDLQALAQKALIQAIEQLLDKPGFRAAVTVQS
jgi:hypothetical protein